jgi:hypothetical protein
VGVIAAGTQSVEQMCKVARLGFDDGWLMLSRRFLNFGLPVLLVDYRLLEPVQWLGLEHFGLRDPRRRLRTIKVQAEVAGGGVILWSTPATKRSLLAAHWFEQVPAPLHDRALDSMILITGDTYRVQLSWSALWTCSIGVMPVGRDREGTRSRTQ